MNTTIKYCVYWLAVLFIVWHSESCTTAPQNKGVYTQAMLAEPKSVHPTNFADNLSYMVSVLMYQPLEAFDLRTQTLVPVLAVAPPTFRTRPDGKVEMAYEIRRAAHWDNGTPITAADVLFSAKAVRCPLTNCASIKPSLESIDDIILDPQNPQRFVVLWEKAVGNMEATFGTLYVMPEYFYDPNKSLRTFSLDRLRTANDPLVKAFADDFNSDAHIRTTVAGSSAYRLVEWTAKQKMVFERKKDWWANGMTDNGFAFGHGPDRIIYRFLQDPAAGLIALQNDEIDGMMSIPPDRFYELTNNPRFRETHHLLTPPSLAYDYLALNLSRPALADLDTRRAIAHLLDIDYFVRIQHGYCERATTYLPPPLKKWLNDSLTIPEYDLNEARRLLANAGWSDTDHDGTLDRKGADGKTQTLALSLVFGKSIAIRKVFADILTDRAAKVGIKIEIEPLEPQAAAERARTHAFDLYLSGNSFSAPLDPDLINLFHSHATLDGQNYAAYASPEADALLDAIRIEPDEARRIALHKKLQKRLADDLPCLFLYSVKQRIAISKRFDNVYGSSISPYVWAAGFEERK